MIKVYTYFDEWLNKFIEFHKSLESPYNWVIPLLEICLLFMILYYLNYFIPRGKK